MNQGCLRLQLQCTHHGGGSCCLLAMAVWTERWRSFGYCDGPWSLSSTFFPPSPRLKGGVVSLLQPRDVNCPWRTNYRNKCVLHTHNTNIAVEDGQEHHDKVWALSRFLFLSLTLSALQCVYNAWDVKAPVVIAPIQGCALLLALGAWWSTKRAPTTGIHALFGECAHHSHGDHKWDTHREA